MSINYRSQLETVIHFISMQVKRNWLLERDEQFNEVVSIDSLSRLACLSKRNFQLLFKAYLNETVRHYINRVRLEYAQQLLKEGRYTQQEIAERTGWANDTAYYNAFKKWYDSSPAQLQRSRFGLSDGPSCAAHPYVLIDFLGESILFYLAIGDYEKCASTSFEESSWNRLYHFASERNLLPEAVNYWGICYDDRSITQDEKCRFYAALSVTALPRLGVSDEIMGMRLTAGTYALYRYEGAYSGLDLFYNQILQQLPAGYHLGEGVILERYLNSPTDTPENELLTEVWLPVER